MFTQERNVIYIKVHLIKYYKLYKCQREIILCIKVKVITVAAQLHTTPIHVPKIISKAFIFILESTFKKECTWDLCLLWMIYSQAQNIVGGSFDKIFGDII